VPDQPLIPAVDVRHVDMVYHGVAAVKDASFSLESGRFLTILGPSGSGKTTLLRMIAGFQSPTSGEILINGQPAGDRPPHKRSIGMVFQRLALFPHLNAADNIAFPLKMRRADPGSIPERVARFLDLVRLGGLGARRIHELSGGQQQRVAIARALVFEPDLLLLDEPLAALDRKLREEMQLEFRRIQKELGVTTINVTHDQREALVVSDEIIVMDHGRIQQAGEPERMYRKPANAFVAGFIGVTTFIPGTAEAGGLRCGGVSVAGMPPHDPDLPAGSPCRGAIRAEQIRIAPDMSGLAALENRFEARVLDVIFEGERLLYEASVPALGDHLLRIYHHDPAGAPSLAPGTLFAIGWNASDMPIFATKKEAD
jgi:putative spermidine/putrescine transport system ATP-binding protein